MMKIAECTRVTTSQKALNANRTNKPNRINVESEKPSPTNFGKEHCCKPNTMNFKPLKTSGTRSSVGSPTQLKLKFLKILLKQRKHKAFKRRKSNKIAEVFNALKKILIIVISKELQKHRKLLFK